MRVVLSGLLAAMLLCIPIAAHGSEKGLIIRPGDLRSQPFVDAPVAAKVVANQQVTILQRQSGWLRVESNGQTGWVRALNVRLEPKGWAGALQGAAGGNSQSGSGGKSRGEGNAQAASSGRGAGNAQGTGKPQKFNPSALTSTSPAAMLRTGSSGRTVTTGVKGMDEEDIRNATIDYAELERLNALGAAPADATANARKNKLRESEIAYLKKGKGK